MARSFSILALILVVATPQEGGASECDKRISLAGNSVNRIEVSEGGGKLRFLSPTFFGFNLEWLDFQQDLWDGEQNTVRKDVVEHLKAFPGAVYRYPGGTTSNHVNWKETIGPLGKRPLRKHADWLNPIRPAFGFDEYLNFIAKVDGQAWVVANIYGDYIAERDGEFLAHVAGEWATHAYRREDAGHPRVLRWELGNELDRGKTLWPPTKYAERASATARAISLQNQGAKFVAMMQDWPAQRSQGISVSNYNRVVMRGVASVTKEFAHHLYYEELTWDSVQKRIGLICQSIQDANVSGISNPIFWVTEHARGLPGDAGSPEWKRTWPKTANLEAGLIAAEAYIIGTQLPELQGLFLHSLGTSHGPWPLFNATRQGSVHPSAVYWSLFVLRSSMLSTVVPTLMHSRNDGRTLGGNDVRGVVLTDDTKSRYSVWTVNRSQNFSELQIKIPELSGRILSAAVVSLGDENKEANNYASPNRVMPKRSSSTMNFSVGGVATVVLPPYSVSTLQFSTH